MFEDLNWRSAARRAAVVIAIYLGLLYVLSVAFPESSFGFQSRAQIISLLVNAVFFFFIFTVVYAFIERSRNRRIAEMRRKSKETKSPAEDPDDSALKGRPNPNTSRKKARRRR